MRTPALLLPLAALATAQTPYWGSYELTIPGGSGAGNAVQLLNLPDNAPEFFQFSALKNGPLPAPTFESVEQQQQLVLQQQQQLVLQQQQQLVLQQQQPQQLRVIQPQQQQAQPPPQQQQLSVIQPQPEGPPTTFEEIQLQPVIKVYKMSHFDHLKNSIVKLTLNVSA